MKTEKELLKEANDIIRSFKYVIDRQGGYTNWNGLKLQTDRILKEQHKYLYPTIKEIRLQKLNRIKT